MTRPSFSKRTKLKLKGRQLSELQDDIAYMQYAIERALHDCFLRQEVFELLEGALEHGENAERVLL